MSTVTSIIKDRFNDAKTAINSQYSIESFMRSKGFTIKSNRQICCPFHDDSTPSFSVDTENNVWKCFGCPDGGHYLDLWIKYSNKFEETKHNIYSAVEHFVSTDSELQQLLGFSSIYKTEDTVIDLFGKPTNASETEIDVKMPTQSATSFFEHKLQRKSEVHIVDTVSMQDVMDTLHSTDINTVIAFIADCEQNCTEEQLISKYFRQKDTLADYIAATTTSAEETDELAQAFMEALNEDI